MTDPRPPPPAAASTPDAGSTRGDPRRLGLLVAVVIVAAALLVVRPWQRQEAAYGPVAQVAPAAGAAGLETAPAVGKLAPNFRLRTVDGGEVVLSDLRGQPVFLNFWATWCLFCVTEMPAMQKLADRHGDALAVVGVNVGEEAERARRFAASAEIRYPLLLDAERAVTRAYDVRAMPTSVYLDADGVVRNVTYGTVLTAEMEEFLAPLLEPAARGKRSGGG